MFILNLYADGISGGVGFVVKRGGSFKGAVTIEGKEGIITAARTGNKKIGKGGVGVWIGGIKFTHNVTDGLVFGNGKWRCGVEVGRWPVGDGRDVIGVDGSCIRQSTWV